MANSEFIGAHYRRLVNDGEYRKRMLADPLKASISRSTLLK